MCGIAGWIGPNIGWDEELLRQQLGHRGPDASGVWKSESATLIHTRLAIIDVGENGSQPMMDSDGKKLLVFNGEIYNYREINGLAPGHADHAPSQSDTRTLLRFLSRWNGEQMEELAGMFAFCYWDSEKQEAVLGRDAFGIKPLYYRIDSGTLSFSSEAKSLHRPGDRTDAEALRDYFLWGSMPETRTLNAAVRQLPAGSILRWANGTARIERWHCADWGTSMRPPQRSEDPTLSVRQALQETIGRHFVSDVPVGIFLSGGIDSTAVLALAREHLGADADLRTFSIGFSDAEFDESSVARRTADHFGTQHTEWKMTAEDGSKEIADYLRAVDQPTIDGFNTWCVSRLASRHGMKVVLSGLGGDEWFAGYGSFRRVPMYRTGHRLLGTLRRFASRMLHRRPTGSPWRRLACFLETRRPSLLQAYHVQRGIFTESEAADLTFALTGDAPDPADWGLDGAPDNPRAAVSYLEITRYMRNQLLRDSDVFSMAHGLELRVPLVDVRLAERLLAVAPDIRLRQGKKLLLDAVPEIPDWVRNRPKQGFRFPFEQWISGRFGDALEEARRVSPVELRTWYRTWAVALALQILDRNDGAQPCA